MRGVCACPDRCRAIADRAGTARPRRPSRRARSPRSPRPCGRRGRACGRRATRCGCSAWRSATPAQIARDRQLVAAGIERAGGDEGAGGRAADAGIAMHDHRLAPGPSRARKRSAVRRAPRRADVAVHRLGDVVHAEDEMVGRPRCSSGRCTRSVSLSRVTMWRAPVPRPCVQARKGADVNHRIATAFA